MFGEKRIEMILNKLVDPSMHTVYSHPLCPLLVESVPSSPGGR